MNLKNKLQHPFALIVQGFVAGAIIFYPAAPSETDVRRARSASSASALPS